MSSVDVQQGGLEDKPLTSKGHLNYTDANPLIDQVRETYRKMHLNQTVDFVRGKREKWLSFDHAELTLMEICQLLDTFVDESDPDIDFPNSLHAYQTAELMRQDGQPDWFQLTGFIHGKLKF